MGLDINNSGKVFVLAISALIMLYLLYQVIHLIRGYALRLVSGISMFPTLKDGQIVLERKVRRGEWIFRGDIVVAKLPQNDYLVIKRVIDIVSIEGKLYYWLEGDNKDHSVDSRTYGHVKKEYIEGKVIKTWKKQWN